MKALTLHQPWASLIAIGVKTIETRSWATKYRGPLAVHAGGVAATLSDGGQGWDHFTLDEYRASRGYAGAEEFASPLPLGAVIATCRMADCVPTERLATCIDVGGRGWGIQEIGNVPLVDPDQYPYSDFTPGRFAWLLDDAKPSTERCPACWGAESRPVTDPNIDAPDGATVTIDGWAYTRGPDTWEPEPCLVCRGTGKSEPVPASGHKGLWTWDQFTAR